jgi:Tol biopolymer transport system component
LTDSEFFPDNFAGSVSGDGSSIVFLDSRLTLFLMNVGGGNLRQLTDNANLPSISDDGSKIAFMSSVNSFGSVNPDESSEVFVIGPDGSGLQQVTDTPGNLFPGLPVLIGGPEISGDGSRIAFFSIDDLTGDNPDGNLEIFLINADGTGLRQVTGHTSGEIQGTIGLFLGSVPDRKLSVSADGLRIAFASDADLSGDNSDGSDELFQVTCPALP